MTTLEIILLAYVLFDIVASIIVLLILISRVLRTLKRRIRPRHLYYDEVDIYEWL